jgi:branched-chain amino acid transport system substrate-binding protein
MNHPERPAGRGPLDSYGSGFRAATDKKRVKMFIAVLLMLAAWRAPACGAEAIKIGDINTYSGQAAFTGPYRKGAHLALEEINGSGGVLGRPLALVSRDDNGKPEDAVRAASELVESENVAALTGTLLSNVGLAVSDFANQHKVLFLAAEALSDALTWQRGNRYTFRVRSSTYMQSAMLVEQVAKLPARRWAVLAPNFEFGHSAVDTFKRLLSQRRPDVEWVAEQYPALGKLDAGPTVEALAQAKPDALFNATFGTDLVRFVREANDRDFLKRLTVASVLTGQPDFLDPLKDEAPVGWIVTGYPWNHIDAPEHQRFLAAYEARFHDYPRAGSLSGYTTMKALATAIAKANSTDTDRMIAALEGLQVESPLGSITIRAIDHQSTMGMYVGRIALEDGKGTMRDFFYADGAKFLPGDEEVRRLRPAP